MRAWTVTVPGPLAGVPLQFVHDLRLREPGPHEVVVDVSVCGVCRTDLHVVTRDLPVHRRGVVPGHEVVGRVVARGPEAVRFEVGERVGVAWLHRSCGVCRWCRHGRENLCEAPVFTGWDVDGGYQERMLADERFVYSLPDSYDDAHAAPLLCAGIIGFRALRAADLPPGGALGIYGFGASAHLTAQVARVAGARVHVVTRSAAAVELARELGAASASQSGPPPEPLDAAILFAPAGELVPPALEALDAAGTLVLAGIHLSAVPQLDYQRHLFRERRMVSVTANTREDGDRFLRLAAQLPLDVRVTPYRFEDADLALLDLEQDRVEGAAVLIVDDQTETQRASVPAANSAGGGSR